MNRIVEVFGQPSVLLPVVHPISRQAALDAVRAASDLGVKGVFLINQPMKETELFELAWEVRERWPSLWIGLNVLGRSPADALSTIIKQGLRIDGLWSDNAHVNERSPDHGQAGADAFVTVRRALRWSGLYFGGVAFKYQQDVADDDLPVAGSIATRFMDVLCTSGPATGHPARLEKVRALRGGLDQHAMALASGITVDNVHTYLPYVQAFLVGTGIEKTFGVLDPAKIEALLRAIESR